MLDNISFIKDIESLNADWIQIKVTKLKAFQRLFFCVLVNLLFGSISLFAQEPFDLSPYETSKNITGSYISYLLDESDTLQISDITSNAFQSRFLTSASEIPSFGYSPSTVWLKLIVRVPENNSRKLLLEVALAGLDLIEVYEKKGNTWDTRVFGDLLPFSKREINYRNVTFAVADSSEKISTIYLKFKTRGTLILPLILHSRDRFFESKILLEGWLYSFYAILAVMIFYNGFIFIAFRSVSYFLYSASTFFLLLFYVGFNGHGFQFLYPNSIFLQNYLVPVCISIAWIFLLEFTIRFLDFKQVFVKLTLLFRVFQLISLLFIPALFFSLQQVSKYQTISGFFEALLILIAGTMCMFRGYKAARYFVLGWALFILGIIFIIFRSLGLLPTNPITTYTMQIGSVFEIIFSSLALADKYRFILAENNKVQGEILEYQIEQNETLERKVKERTLQLEQSLTLIKQDLAVAKKIQQNTLMINYHSIEKLEIIPFYMAMTEVGGDFYGINKVTDSKYRFFLADATGHGIQAALITMAIKGIYDNIKNYDLSIKQLMEIFNDEYIQKYGSLNTYLTCIIVDIDVENQLLEVTSAGHPSCLLLDRDGTISFPKTGRMIGIFKDAEYDSFQYEFNPGDRLFLFTDGIFEEFNTSQEEFGEERLQSILQKSKDMSIEKSIHEVLTALDQFLDGKEKQDDITILGIGYKG